jgi:MFS family permease
MGRRPVLLITVGGLTLSYLLWFLSGSFALLVAARLFGGAMAGNISVATAAVADSTTRENRAKGMGLVGAAFGLGFILGPAGGAALSRWNILELAPGLEALGVNPFSGAAAGAFLLSAANFLLLWRLFPETLRPEDRGKAREERRTINPAELFRPAGLPGVSRANLAWFIYLVAFSGMEFTLTFLAAERFGFTARQNAYMFVFIGLILIFVQGGMIRQLAPLYGEKALALAGLGTVIPGLIVTGLAQKQGALYLGLGLMALGGAFVMPSLSALVSLYAPPERQGSVLGVFRSLGALARAIGPLAASLVYFRFGSAAPYLAGAAALLVPLVVAAGLPRPVKDAGIHQRS